MFVFIILFFILLLLLWWSWLLLWCVYVWLDLRECMFKGDLLWFSIFSFTNIPLCNGCPNFRKWGQHMWIKGQGSDCNKSTDSWLCLISKIGHLCSPTNLLFCSFVCIEAINEEKGFLKRGKLNHREGELGEISSSSVKRISIRLLWTVNHAKLLYRNPRIWS